MNTTRRKMWSMCRLLPGLVFCLASAAVHTAMAASNPKASEGDSTDAERNPIIGAFRQVAPYDIFRGEVLVQEVFSQRKDSILWFLPLRATGKSQPQTKPGDWEIRVIFPHDRPYLSKYAQITAKNVSRPGPVLEGKRVPTIGVAVAAAVARVGVYLNNMPLVFRAKADARGFTVLFTYLPERPGGFVRVRLSRDLKQIKATRGKVKDVHISPNWEDAIIPALRQVAQYNVYQSDVLIQWIYNQRKDRVMWFLPLPETNGPQPPTPANWEIRVVFPRGRLRAQPRVSAVNISKLALGPKGQRPPTLGEAVTAAEVRLHKDYDRSRKVRLEDLRGYISAREYAERFYIMFVGLPARPGGFTGVEVSKDLKRTDVHPGL